jgi:signal transduction histidine kinase
MQGKLVFADRMSTLGTLAAGVAHEINNPLTYVMANLEHLVFRLTQSGTPTLAERERMIKAVEDALYGSERVREIVRDLSHLARPERIEDRPVDVRRAVQASLRMAQHQIQKRAQIVEEIEEVPIVRGSSARLSQVFLNLLINAAHAIPDGDPESNQVRVRSGSVGGKVFVEVQDTGGGIPSDVLPQIFDPFFTTKDVGVGTGLGLSICHAIVVDHGGEIEVTSDAGTGTTFRVLLPASAVAEAEVADEPLERKPVGALARG